MRLLKWIISLIGQREQKERRETVCEQRGHHRDQGEGCLTHDDNGDRKVGCRCLDCGVFFLRDPNQEESVWFPLFESMS